MKRLPGGATVRAIHEVFFPESAVISQMTVMENGDTLQTATVGCEGASWISASIGAPSMPCETIVVIGGDARALSVDDLDEEMRDNEHFRDLLTQYSHALLIHSMRLTGCTGLHSLPQRCARWILTMLDRVVENRFSVTHEFLAMLLGSSRPSVSVVIEDFERRGMLRSERGPRINCVTYVSAVRKTGRSSEAQQIMWQRHGLVEIEPDRVLYLMEGPAHVLDDFHLLKCGGQRFGGGAHRIHHRLTINVGRDACFFAGGARRLSGLA